MPILGNVKKRTGALFLIGVFSLVGDASASMGVFGSFDPVACRPGNPNDVRVVVSLSNQMNDVMDENRRPLATPACMGTADKPTPRGNSTAYKRVARKCSPWCRRAHRNVAAEFFELVRGRATVDLALSHPEDAAIGSGIRRSHDFNYPDPPFDTMTSHAVFAPPAGPLFAD